MSAIGSPVVSGEGGKGEVARPGVGTRVVLNAAFAYAGYKVGAGDPALIGAGLAAGAGIEPIAEVFLSRLPSEWRRDQEENVAAVAIVAAAEGGWSAQELGRKAGRSQATRLLTGTAADAAAKTAWPPKVIALGRVLAQGLIAADDAAVDVPAYMLAAMTEMERLHISLLELLVRSEPEAEWQVGWKAIPHRIPSSVSQFVAGGGPLFWSPGRRIWTAGQSVTRNPSSHRF